MYKFFIVKSPSTRRAWIEITLRVKRNVVKVRVALHPEGVDRNVIALLKNKPVAVALHPEGVDRNVIYDKLQQFRDLSPSTRRAWIEIRRVACITITDTRRPPPGGRG